jgi:transcriptional regulator with XRE-family HTH domain
MIPSIPADLDLKKLRDDADLTQTDLAKRLGVTQSQILRYEAEPENVPLRIVREWVAACGHLDAGHGLNVGMPYAWIGPRLDRLRDYALNQPPMERDDTIVPPVGVEDLITVVSELRSKPRIVLCGQYDAGKSRLANTLLGADRLPTAYQPATRIVCLVRHIDDKPDWQPEAVWIMDDQFKLADALDKSACEAHRFMAGDLETLRRFGTHNGDYGDKLQNPEPGAALVYLDSPILHACDLIDTPGLGNDDDDAALAKSAWAYGDAVLYLSPVNGFLNGEDIRAIATLVGALPAQANADRLAGLAILATHAHPGISDADVSSTLERGAARLHRSIAPLFNLSGSDSGQQLDAESLRRRFFPWYVETPSRRGPFEADLQRLLKSIFPTAIAARLDNAAAAFGTKADKMFGREVEQLESLLSAHGNAAQKMQAILDSEPDRQMRTRESEQRIAAIIAKSKSETEIFLKNVITPLFAEDALRKLIDERFTESKEAEQQAGNAALTEARVLIERFIEEQTAPLTREVEEFLGKYSVQIEHGLGAVIVPFDARAVFLGSLAGGGVFGALAGWAAIVAGGSNLGAYLLVPQVVSLLARLGIGIAGGTATGVSVVSALGGPVGIGIAIAVAAGMIAWQVFGRSWQARLARGLAAKFVEHNVLGKIWVACERCWDDTLRAFESAAKSTEKQHVEYLLRLKAQLQTPAEVLQARVIRIKARRAFLSFIPWSPVEGTER